MNNDLIDRVALKEELVKLCGQINAVSEKPVPTLAFVQLIDNAPTVNPCKDCDLYFKAMTKEEMRKGGAEE